jgi:hypothetical protein
LVENTLRHPEELHSTILKGMIEGKRPPGRPAIFLSEKSKRVQELEAIGHLKK